MTVLPPDDVPQVAERTPPPETLRIPPSESLRGRGLGCGMILLLGLCTLALAAIGTAGGLLAYGMARGLGTPSLVVSIAAGLIAMGIVFLTTPIGFGLLIALYPSVDHPVVKTVGVLVVAALGPIVRFQEVLFFAVLAGIGAGLMFHWYQPLTASILLAVVFPVVGFVTAALIGGDGGRGVS